MRNAGKARVNGNWVDLEYVEPERQRSAGRGFFTNPDLQRGVYTAVGMGVGAYKLAAELAGYIPNPVGSKFQRALPWAAIAALAFLGAPHCKVMKNPMRIAGSLSAGKAIWEMLRG